MAQNIRFFCIGDIYMKWRITNDNKLNNVEHETIGTCNSAYHLTSMMHMRHIYIYIFFKLIVKVLATI